MNLETIDLIKWSLAPICTLLAGYVGVRWGLKQVRLQKKLDFIQQQLREFYSPLLGYHKEIRAKGEMRVKISKAASEAWTDLCSKGPQSPETHNAEYKPYGKIIEYNSEQLKNEMLPLYRKMLSTFGEKYWLAEPETRKWYSELCDFVELWNRWISDTIPADVIKKIDPGEEKLIPFYQELETRMDVLRKKLSE